MTTPVALVTGTSSGIGLQAALRLAAAGHTVVATVRDPARATDLRAAAADAGVELDIRALDVTDLPACAALVEGVVADHGRLDLLVNNAGRGRVATLEQLTDADLADVMTVNFSSVAALTRAALPALRESRGRVVTVTSVGGVVGQPLNDAYCAAKFAVEGLMQSLAPVAALDGVGVHVVEPGPVATRFVDNVERPAGGDRYDAVLAAYLQRASGVFAAAQDAGEVAQVVVDTATGSDVPFRVQTSDGARAFAGLSLADLDGSRVLDATSGWLRS